MESGSRGLFSIGGHWIERHPGSGYLYRYVYDPRRRRTVGQSLKTKDIEEAKRRLIEHVQVVGRGPGLGVRHASEVALAVVLDFYKTHHLPTIPSRRRNEDAIAELAEWSFEVKKLPDGVKADAFRRDYQEEFVLWLAGKGQGAANIARTMTTIRAAFNYAAREQTVVLGGREEERMIAGREQTVIVGGERRNVQLMRDPPIIMADADWIAKVAKIAPPGKKSWVPTDRDVAGFIDAIRTDAVFYGVILLLNTWARRETVEEMDLAAQAHLEERRLDLNHPDRLQTDKRRPSIRMTDNLAAWIAFWRAHGLANPLATGRRARPGRSGHALSIRKALERASFRWALRGAGVAEPEITRLFAPGAHKELVARIHALEEAGAHRINARTLRTYMTTRIRRVRPPVPREQRQLWLGHLNDTTSAYEVDDPDYLAECAAGTDQIIRAIDGHAKRSLWPPKGEVAE